MENILEGINSFVWGAPALVMILGVGIYLSVRTKFAQLRLFPTTVRNFYDSIKNGGDSSFKALCTALAATVGTGNIAGVAGAIAIGGPGSIFWMWICGILGMVTKFAEAALSVQFRDVDASGNLLGGPMYMIRNGMNRKWHFLATVYCLFGVVAAFGVGNATQINAVTDSIGSVLSFFGRQQCLPGKLLTGILLAVLTGICLLGGSKRIGNIAYLLIPFAAGGYILLGMGAIAAHWRKIPYAFHAILEGAICPEAVTGGIIGSALTSLRVGASRGVFTNEAGMGTAGIAHGAAENAKPVRQGMMGIMEVFLDTILICTLTALVILTSGVSIPYGLDEGAALTVRAFACTYSEGVSIPIAVFLCCFAFGTMLGWGLYGLQCARYLFGDRSWKYFVFLQMAASVVSVLLDTGTIWMLAETVNGLMAIPSLIAVAALSRALIRLLHKYEKEHRRGAP